jgi:hypothetical protein
MSVYPHIIASQCLSKHVPLATNIHATIEELSDVVFSLWSLLYQILSMSWKESRLLVFPRAC